MLKTISAALLAVSVIAAPALAAETGKTAQAPATKTTPPAAKTTQAPAPKTTPAPVAKATQTKPSAINANAQMGRHHVKHHRHYKKMSVIKSHSKVGFKHAAPATKRG